MKATFEWTKTVTQRYSATIQLSGGADLRDWDMDALAQEIHEDCAADDAELIDSALIDTYTHYEADLGSIETTSDEPPVMPGALCTSP